MRIRAAICLLTITSRVALAQGETGMQSVVGRVVHDLCDKRVALLGESSLHAFGETLAFKAEVTRRLVNECHYNVFLIESGAYDFLEIAKTLGAHRSVDDSTVEAAIGGIWANQDMAALVPFLAEKANAGALMLAGLDDQLSRGTWAQRGMAKELTAHLQSSERSTCLAILERHMLWQYSADAPFGPADKARILGCIDKIDASLSRVAAPRQRSEGDYDRAMLDNLRRMFARELRDSSADLKTRLFNDRDSSMYRNFRWWSSRFPSRAKVIVWTATVHAAKSLRGVPGSEKQMPMGSYIQHEFGDGAFVLAFSARSGRYRLSRQPERTLTPAPDTTLEGRLLANKDADTRYVGHAELRQLGAIAARPFSQDFALTKWDEVFDGIVVFREERPPRLR
jgi:erythromycin esterase-like protein